MMSWLVNIEFKKLKSSLSENAIKQIFVRI